MYCRKPDGGRRGASQTEIRKYGECKSTQPLIDQSDHSEEVIEIIKIL
jgi:hypothetical protein